MPYRYWLVAWSVEQTQHRKWHGMTSPWSCSGLRLSRMAGHRLMIMEASGLFKSDLLWNLWRQIASVGCFWAAQQILRVLARRGPAWWTLILRGHWVCATSRPVKCGGKLGHFSDPKREEPPGHLLEEPRRFWHPVFFGFWNRGWEILELNRGL